MKLAYYIKTAGLSSDPRVSSLLMKLREGGAQLYPLFDGSVPEDGTEMLLSLGGDGTFLSASRLAAPQGIPVLGVNFGHLGFLSENSAEDAAEAVLSGKFKIEERTMLQAVVEVDGKPSLGPVYALNEITVSRVNPQMLHVDVALDGRSLPTYHADGVLVSTSSGSTAYSMSVGGPICLPDSKVMILAPVAPHNLNIRPLVVPETTHLRLEPHSRDGAFMMTADNLAFPISEGCRISVSAAPMRLKRVFPGNSNFIQALTDRLLWGGDVRNNTDKN